MSRVAHVAIVGRDAAAWLTARALQRALGRTGLAITLVELPSELTPASVYSAVPSFGGLQRMLGLEEADVLAHAAAVPVVGQRFTGWSGAGGAFVHGYDVTRARIGDVDFAQFWSMARRRGMSVPFDAFSVAATAALAGKLPRPGREPESLGDIATGMHVDARRYVALVARAAVANGLRHLQTDRVSVERNGDRVTAVTLSGGERVEADFFVDATGEAALLLAGLPGAEVEDWSRWLPADRLLMASAPPLNPVPTLANIAAFQAGWMGMFPLQDRTALVAAFDSTLISDDDVVRSAASVIGVAPRDVSAQPFRAGVQRRPWIGNCVAVGAAAVRLEPLDGVALHLIHTGISHLIALFPVTAGSFPESSSYNRVVGATLANLRDFQALHYALNRRTGEPYWDAARAAELPPALAHRLRLFAARGELAAHDDESFEAQSWAACMIGHGIVPADHAPQVELMPPADVTARFQGFIDAIAAEVRAMPDLRQYLAGGKPSPAQASDSSGLY